MKFMYNQQLAAEIVERYINPLYSYALKKTANLQDAEDLAQEIILKLYNSLLNKQIYNLDAFVWRLAHNVLVNYYRGKSKSSIGISFDVLESTMHSNEEPADELIEKETIKRLQHEIAYLSKAQREILIMYYYEGRKLEEIAARLKLPLGTVKWHRFNARNEIKKGMDSMKNVNELKFNPVKFTGTGISGSTGTMGGPWNFFRSVLTWSNREIDIDSYSNEIIQRDLQLLSRFFRGDALSGDEIAYMVQKGYLKAAGDRAAYGALTGGKTPAGKSSNDKFELAIIRLKDETISQQLIQLCNRVRAKNQAELKPLKEEYARLVLENVPRHIQKMKAYGLQYTFYSDGLFLKYCMKELFNNGRLKLPTEEQRVSLSTLIIQ